MELPVTFALRPHPPPPTTADAAVCGKQARWSRWSFAWRLRCPSFSEYRTVFQFVSVHLKFTRGLFLNLKSSFKLCANTVLTHNLQRTVNSKLFGKFAITLSSSTCFSKTIADVFPIQSTSVSVLVSFFFLLPVCLAWSWHRVPHSSIHWASLFIEMSAWLCWFIQMSINSKVTVSSVTKTISA